MAKRKAREIRVRNKHTAEVAGVPAGKQGVVNEDVAELFLDYFDLVEDAPRRPPVSPGPRGGSDGDDSGEGGEGGGDAGSNAQ